MRISSPGVIPRGAPTNSRNSLAGKWMAAINEKKSSEPEKTQQQQQQQPRQQQQQQHPRQQQQRQPQEQEHQRHHQHPKIQQQQQQQQQQEGYNTLGSFLLTNHDVINKIANFGNHVREEYEYEYRDDIGLPNPSLTSTQEMERAGQMNRFSGDDYEKEHEPSHSYIIPQGEERLQGYIKRGAYRDEQREAPPDDIYRYGHGNENNDYNSSNRSAFQSVRPLRTTPTRALFDESLASPQDAGIQQHQQQQPNNIFQAPEAVTAYSIASKNHHTSTTTTDPPSDTPLINAIPTQTNSFFEMLKPNFLQRSCAPLNVATDEENIKAEKIWSYLDLDPDHNDLKYDDNNSESSSERVSRNKTHRRKKSRSPRKLKRNTHQQQQKQHMQPLSPQDSFQQAFQDLTFAKREDNNISIQRERQYHQPMKQEIHHPYHRHGGGGGGGGPSNDKHSRSSTPTTTRSGGDRSNYTQSTARTTPDPSLGRNSNTPTSTNVREELWRTHSPQVRKLNNDSPCSANNADNIVQSITQSPSRNSTRPHHHDVNNNGRTMMSNSGDPSISQQHHRASEAKSSFTREKAIIFSNKSHPACGGADQKNDRGRSQPRERLPQPTLSKSRPNSRGRTRQENNIQFSDGTAMHQCNAADRRVSRSKNTQQSSHGEPEVTHQGPTPRASNRDGFETTAAFSSSRHRATSVEPIETAFPNRQTAKPKITPRMPPPKATTKRETTTTTPQRERRRQVTTRTKPKSSRTRSNENLTEQQGIFPFTQDLYMFEALHKELSAGLPMGFSTQNVLPTIELGDGESTKVSLLSSDDESITGQDEKTLKEKLNQVRWRSLRNVEKLEELEKLNRNTIPDRLPGVRKSDSVSSGGLNSFDAMEYANCMSGFEKRVEHVGNEIGIGLGLDNNIHRDKSFEPSETSSAAVPPKSSTVATQKKDAPEAKPIKIIQEDFEGHYMYVAYSRFGQDAREVLQLCEHQTLPIPNHRSGEVLITILASTVSTTDCEVRRGEWSEVHLNPYIIPGTAFVGTIHHTEKKSAFSSFKPGDIVMSLVKSGSNARYTCATKDQLIKVPQKLDPDRLVCLTETYLSAFQALHLGQRGSIRYRDYSLKGRSILITGGYSSLGRALIELSLAAGAEFCYVLAKSKQFSAISRVGAIPLSRDPQDWLTLIGRQISTMVAIKDGTDLYTEPITKEHMKALNQEGQVVFIGQPGADNALHRPASPSPSMLICKSNRNRLENRSQSYNVFDSWESDPKQARRDMEHLISLLEERRLEPEVLERIPLSKVAKAQSIVEKKRMSGHIVCAPWLKETLQS